MYIRYSQHGAFYLANIYNSISLCKESDATHFLERVYGDDASTLKKAIEEKIEAFELRVDTSSHVKNSLDSQSK